jgi:hypothetical protein
LEAVRSIGRKPDATGQDARVIDDENHAATNGEPIRGFVPKSFVRKTGRMLE